MLACSVDMKKALLLPEGPQAVMLFMYPACYVIDSMAFDLCFLLHFRRSESLKWAAMGCRNITLTQIRKYSVTFFIAPTLLRLYRHFLQEQPLSSPKDFSAHMIHNHFEVTETSLPVGKDPSEAHNICVLKSWMCYKFRNTCFKGKATGHILMRVHATA